MNMLGEERHGFEFLRACGLVDDHLQPGELALDEWARKQMQSRRIDRGFEHSVPCAIEANELAARSPMHDRRLDP
jgi:hypothetical protein